MHRIAVVVLVIATVGTGVGAGQPVPEGCGFPVTVTDATGTDVTVTDEPARIVVLAPSAAQTVWELDASDRVVGMPVSQYTSYLPGSETRTNVVGEDGQVVQSRVVDLQPDLVLAPNVIRNETIASLRRADQTVYRFREARSLDDVSVKTELTGRLIGEPDAGRHRAARTRATIRTVESAVDGRERPDVYYVLGGGFTAGSDTFIHDVMTTAGGRNIAATANISGYKQISSEVVATQDPDWIVRPSGTPLPRNPAINGTTAVENEQILTVESNLINQPGPRVTEPLETMTTAFHPTVTIPDVISPTSDDRCQSTTGPTPEITPTNSDQTPTETDLPDTVTQPSSGTDTVATETPGASGPGFTPVVTVLALILLVVGLVKRRA